MDTTFLLYDTENFMRGDLDNVTVADGRIVLDMVQGAYVPYGCYTSPVISMPMFDALRVSWNASTPAGTAIEAQARVLVDGNWTPWVGFGKWSPYLKREGPAPTARGVLVHHPDELLLDSKMAAQAQLRIYLYTREEKATPAVQLLGCGVHPVNVIPAGGRPANATLHLMPYVVARRAPVLRPWMDLAIGLASLTNRWGADILPEEFALAMRDHRPADAQDPRNLCFAAATAGCWGFPTWVCWADLAALREELRRGYGAILALESSPAQQAQGVPAVKYVTLRGFGIVNGEPHALLCDPWAGEDDFDAEVTMPLDDLLVAWNNLALFMRKRKNGPLPGWPARGSINLSTETAGLYHLYKGLEEWRLPDDFCEPGGGVLAYSLPDVRPHATTAHKRFCFALPEAGGIRLPDEAMRHNRCSVFAIEPSGRMLAGDIHFA